MFTIHIDHRTRNLLDVLDVRRLWFWQMPIHAMEANRDIAFEFARSRDSRREWASRPPPVPAWRCRGSDCSRRDRHLQRRGERRALAHRAMDESAGFAIRRLRPT